MTGDKAINGDGPQTPPSNLFDFPPSPPPTDVKARESTTLPTLNPYQLNFLRALNVPPSSQLHLSFKISKGAYARAIEHLAASEPAVWGYIQDKLRYDLVNDSLIIFHMPTLVHEIVSRGVADTISNRLRLIQSSPTINSDTRRLTQAIMTAGSADVTFTQTWHRQPDDQFMIENVGYPGVILESAYTQSSRNLARAADDYVVQSRGSIQLVIGIEMDPNSKNVYLSTWAPNFEMDGERMVFSCKKITDSDLVRDENGNIMQGELTVNLGHFAPAKKIIELFPQADTTLTVSLSYAEIASIVSKGERVKEFRDQAVKAKKEEMNAETHNMEWRGRESSEERLSSADEKIWEDREDDVSEKAEAADGDFDLWEEKSPIQAT